MYDKNLGPYGDPKGHKGTSIPNNQEYFFNINMLSNIPKNKDMIIKLKLDDNGNLVYLHLEYDEQKNELPVKEVKEEVKSVKQQIQDKIYEFEKEVNKRIRSENFTKYEIECFIEKHHPVNGTNFRK